MLTLRKLFVSLCAATTLVSTTVAVPAPHVPNAVAAASSTGAIFDPRCECYTNPLPVIISDCKDKISPLLDQLKSFGPSDCTADKIKTVVVSIKGVLSEGIDQINILAASNVDLNTRLSNGTSVLSVADCATLLAGLITMIFGCFGVVLKMVVTAQSTAVIAVFADLGICVAQFLKASCTVVSDGSLLTAVVPQITASLGVAITLGITSSFDYCKIDFTKLTGVTVGATVVTAVNSTVATAINSTVATALNSTVATTVVSNTPVSIVLILQDCWSKVSPLLDQLKALSPSDCTADKISLITAQVKTILVSVTAQVKLLSGASADVVLATGNGKTMSITDLSYLCGDIVVCILAALLKVIVSSQSKDAVVKVCVDLCVVIGTFLKACCDVVPFNGGLAAAVIPIVKSSMGVIISLGCTSSFDFLGFDWTQVAKELGKDLTISIATSVASNTTATVIANTTSTVVNVGNTIANTTSTVVNAGTTVVNGTSTAVNAGVVSIVSIFNDCGSKLSPLADQLKKLGANDCTPDKIQPIVDEMKGVLVSATTQIQGLSGKTIEIVLASNGSVISVSDCAKLCGNLVISIFTAVYSVIQIVASSNQKAVFAIFIDLHACIGTFIKTACSVVTFNGGLITALVPVIKGSLHATIKMGCGKDLDFLNIDFQSISQQLGVQVVTSLSVVSVLIDITAKISPLTDQLKNLRASDCTSDKITPIVKQIKDILVAASAQIKGLNGLTVNLILAANGATMSVGDCATLCGKAVICIFDAVSAMLKVVVAGQSKAVIAICIDLCVSVGTFLKVCCDVVSFNGGLSVALLPVIKTSLGVCISLGSSCTSAFGFLGVDFTQLAKDLGVTLGGAVSATTLVSLPAIIADVNAKITPLVAQLAALKNDNCNGGNVNAIAVQIKQIIVAATAQVQLLVGADASVVLASNGKVLSVGDCAAAMAGLCKLFFGAIDAVLSVVTAAQAKVVFGICADLGVTMGAFIKVSCSCVNGLQGALISLITLPLGVCMKLQITNNFSFLNVNWTDITVKTGISIGGILSNLLSGGLRISLKWN
ncbi:hypothetical protein Moror_7000 [Moniliophthora roreri MCA 2997]|uniref:Uncharacterized protein n=1 Tax=Moniliophthora roreri (strain MCA 2997) TaxID=1381753 RepID=V2XRW5_MONRO|nr:hypothetical protein Moror_7000 [Moniliophthora roreri MCA 2997]